MSNLNNHCCTEMDRHLLAGEIAIVYRPVFREYGIFNNWETDPNTKYANGEKEAVAYRPVDESKPIDVSNWSLVDAIHYCPWCGAKLPDNLRRRWFEELDKFGYDNPWEQDIPENFRSDKWWRDTKL